ncbi:MAG TPA: response regulator [Rhizomicrobium sp.]|nr:response regulator [Rhizomicrobium sp.]
MIRPAQMPAQMPAQIPAQIYVVDDDRHILSALRRLLETAGYQVLTYDSPGEFLANHNSSLPGCVLLDIGMAELSGLETQQRMLDLGVSRPIIFITGFDDARTGVDAMKGGAYDYLLKPFSETVLLSTIEGAVLSDISARREREDITHLSKRWSSLTIREREVMSQIIRGRLNKQIASDLNIVEKTVKVHRGRVMEKMGVRSVAGLVHIAEKLRRSGCGEFLPHDHR